MLEKNYNLLYNKPHHIISEEIQLQKEVQNPVTVFRSDGRVKGSWSKNPILKFNTKNYKSAKKIDHRQCYSAENDNCSLYVTLEKAGIEFIVKVVLLDKNTLNTLCDSVVKKYVLSKRKMPDLLSDKILFEDKRVKIAVTTQGENKHLRCQFNNFANRDTLYFDFTFSKKDGESLNLSVPFKNTKNFYFKGFSPNFSVSGKADLGDKSYILSDAYGYCDSTSYVLPYRQIYKYVTAFCNVNGKDFALYLGSKLGDDLSGEENCYFYNRNIMKLSKIKFLGTDERIDKNWSFKAGINAVDVTFKPKEDYSEPIFTKCDKTTIVYGSLYGEFNLVDNEPVILTDVPAMMFYTVI